MSTRILLIRTSALGDVIHALPVLTALRRSLPGARIAWLIEEAYAPVLDGHPDLDRLIPVRLRVWRKRPLSPRTWGEIATFLSALDRFAPEVVLDLMGNHKAGILAAVTLADRRIGLPRSDRREPSSAIWISETVSPQGMHSVDRMLSVLRALGIPPRPADFGADKLFPRATATASQVLIHPGAGWQNKRYAPENWGRVASILHQRLGCKSGVLVAPGEEHLAEGVAQASQGTAEIFWAPDLVQLAGHLRGASLVMGGDSGPLHLAHALGRPVLFVMGPTDPERHGPYGAPERAIWRQLPCSFCHRRYPQIMPCLARLSAEAVAERAWCILSGAGLPPAAPVDAGETGCGPVH